jgi:hypothetical protein
MNTYNVNATREAVDFICIVTDIAPSEIRVNVTVTSDGIDVTSRVQQVAEDRAAGFRCAMSAKNWGCPSSAPSS